MKDDHVNKEDYQCLCNNRETCTDCPVGFEKVLTLKDAGLVIYRHSSGPEIRNKNNEAGGRNVQAKDHGFVFHNTNDTDIISMDVLPQIEKMAVKCGRCRKILENAIKILQKVKAISKKEIVGICDHCKLSEQPCCKCDSVLKKFFETKTKETKRFPFNEEKVNEWLANVQNEFQDYFIDEKESRSYRLKDYVEKYEGVKKPLRAYSDEYIDQLYRQRHNRNERELKIRDLLRWPDEQSLARPLIAATGISKKHVHLNLGVLETEPEVDRRSTISSVSFDTRKMKSTNLKIKLLAKSVSDETLITHKLDITKSTDQKIKQSYKIIRDEILITSETEGIESIDRTVKPSHKFEGGQTLIISKIDKTKSIDEKIKPSHKFDEGEILITSKTHRMKSADRKMTPLDKLISDETLINYKIDVTKPADQKIKPSDKLARDETLITSEIDGIKSTDRKIKPSHKLVGDEILTTSKVDGTISTDKIIKPSHKLVGNEILTSSKIDGDRAMEPKFSDGAHPSVSATQGRDHYWDNIISSGYSTQYEHDAEKQKLYGKKTVDDLVSNFSLTFPSEKIKVEKIVRPKSSSELISEVHDRIRETNEENKRRNENNRLKQLEEKKERKQRARQEKIRRAKDKQRLLEEKKLIERELGTDIRFTDKSKTTSFKDETSSTSTTTFESKKFKSGLDKKGSSMKSRSMKTGLKESKIKMDIKDGKKNKSKFDSQTKFDSKKYNELEAGSIIGLKVGSKQSKPNVKQAKLDPAAGAAAHSNEFEDGSRTGSKQSKANVKQAKLDPSAIASDSNKHEDQSKSRSQQSKATVKLAKADATDLAADSKQYENEDGTRTGLQIESNQPTNVSTNTAIVTNVAVQTTTGVKSASKESKYEQNESKVESKQLKDYAATASTAPATSKGGSKEPKMHAEQFGSRTKHFNAGVKDFKSDSNESKSQLPKTKFIDDRLKPDSNASSNIKGTKHLGKIGINTDSPDFEKGEKQNDDKNKAAKNTNKGNINKDFSKETQAETIIEKPTIEQLFQPKKKDAKSGNETRIPRRQLDAQTQALEKDVNSKKTKQELKVDRIQMLNSSKNNILGIVKLEDGGKHTLPQNIALPQLLLNEIDYKSLKPSDCPLCIESDLELEHESNRKNKIELQEMIAGRTIRCVPAYTEEKGDLDVKPEVYQLKYDDKFIAEIIQPPQHIPTIREYLDEKKETKTPTEEPKGVIRYALSDRTFIEKGWTMLPTEKVVRKMNVYRMRPAKPEFDWFEHNKNKRFMTYDTGERLAEFDDDGHGRLFYKNQRLALQYYDAEELNAQQRFVIYSNGEPDERGRTRPYTILATFDFLGNGIVFDHSGKIRMKYNQTEGIILDKSIGPVSHWKWHTLNDPPVLQQVMIDTHMSYKDPEILKMPTPHDKRPRPDNEDMLAIEFDNFIKEKSKKLKQSFKPFQIKMKALKINENFSLKVLDQATVYLIYRDGTTNIKLNLGMLLDHKEIVDTDTAEVGEVASNVERLPARTDSLAAMQKSVAYAQHFERTRTERERRLRPPEPSASADKLTAAASRPMRPPLRAACSSTATSSSYYPRSRKPPSNTLYYNNRLC